MPDRLHLHSERDLRRDARAALRIVLALVAVSLAAWVARAVHLMDRPSAHRRFEPAANDLGPRRPPADQDPALWSSESSETPREEHWQVVFEDDFERERLGRLWLDASGEWQVRHGELVASKREGRSVALCMRCSMGGDLRVSFTVRVSGERPGGVALVTDLPGSYEVQTRLGYLYRFGNLGNRVSGLSRGMGHFVVNRRVTIVPGRAHRVVVERRDQRFEMAVDGTRVFAGTHRSAAEPPRARWGGFVVWDAEAAFDDLRVESPAEGPRPVTAAVDADRSPTSAREDRARARTVAEPPRTRPRVRSPAPTPEERWQSDEVPTLDPPGGEVSWEVVFTDTFDRRSPGDSWEAVAGRWTVRDGKLVATSRVEESMILCREVDFSGDLRVEYQARTVAVSEAGRPCDMSFMIALPPRHPVHPLAGYLFRLGSFLNTVSGLSHTRREDYVTVYGGHIEAGREHRVTVQRVGDHFSMALDGDPLFSGTLSGALHRPEGSWGGFYVWRSEVEFDDVVISFPEGDAGR